MTVNTLGAQSFTTPRSAVRPSARPGRFPPIDRCTLMQDAHRIAARVRPHMASYAEALRYGLKAAWQQVNAARSFAILNAEVKPRQFTGADLVASRAATHRCGSSYIAA